MEDEGYEEYAPSTPVKENFILKHVANYRLDLAPFKLKFLKNFASKLLTKLLSSKQKKLITSLSGLNNLMDTVILIAVHHSGKSCPYFCMLGKGKFNFQILISGLLHGFDTV